MESKVTQNKLEDGMKSASFSDLVQDLCAKHGQGKLADMIGMDPGSFSNFKNGTGNISMKHLSALLAFSEMLIIPERRYKRILLSLITITREWERSMDL